mmetsp:Transcript_19687/g.44697  ORF Transcript_19687/g.44697 Transcript_19687/m.44697 type:complete len:580 (+) Transcript_19687:235-1974(+)
MPSMRNRGGTSMNIIPTFRQGRTYEHQQGEPGPIGGFCILILISLILIGIPAWCTLSETRNFASLAAFQEVREVGVTALSESSPAGSVVGLQSEGPISAVVSDESFGIEVEALALSRETEYCQWSEHQTRTCQKCERTVHAKDGTSSTESYDCDCIVNYYYSKSWHHHRIPSALFDQPAAHHNPQRDPFPSQTTVAKGGASIAVKSGSPLRASLGPEMLSAVRAPWHRVVWGAQSTRAADSASNKGRKARAGASWFGKDRTRHEPLARLASTPASPAATREGFAYVDQGGWFFSPHEAGMQETLLKAVGQALEGSLLDWQVGHFLPACTAGDVRVRFAVKDPGKVSVLAQVASPATRPLSSSSSKAPCREGSCAPTAQLEPYRTKAGPPVGLVHGGLESPQRMLDLEEDDSRWRALGPRLALFALWSPLVARLGAVALTGADPATAPCFMCWLQLAGAVWCAALGASWLLAGWPLLGASGAAFGLAALLGEAARKGLPPARVRGGWRAAWCMLARWAGLPPEWRVEAGYRGTLAEPAPSNTDDGDDSAVYAFVPKKQDEDEEAQIEISSVLVTATMIDG